MDSSGLPPTFVIGPQGGFSETELVFLRALPFVTTVDLDLAFCAREQPRRGIIMPAGRPRGLDLTVGPLGPRT